MAFAKLNLFSDACIIGLTCRALAAGADWDNAELTIRRIEHLNAEDTEQLKGISEAKASLAILQQKSFDAEKEARQAAADLQLFSREQPEPEPKKGIFGKAKVVEEKEVAKQRSELTELSGIAAEKAEVLKQQAEELSRTLLELERSAAETRSRRTAMRSLLQEESAAHAFSLLLEGNARMALSQLDDMRTLMRGELSVAVLKVLITYFSVQFAGEDEKPAELARRRSEAAREVLLNMRGIFDQYDDPLPRLLETFMQLLQDEPVSMRDLGITGRGSFRIAGHFRLSQLVITLAGYSPSYEEFEDDPFAGTLWALEQYLQFAGEEGSAAPAAAKLAAWAAPGETVVQCLAVNMLQHIGEPELMFEAAGIRLDGIEPPKRKGDQWPDLLHMISARGIPSWPKELCAVWQASLACLLLAAAKSHAPRELYEAWLAQSYGWPKTDLYWQTLALVNDDPSLLSRQGGHPGELFTA